MLTTVKTVAAAAGEMEPAVNAGLLLNGLTMGAQATQRIGRKVTLRSLMVNMCIRGAYDGAADPAVPDGAVGAAVGHPEGQYRVMIVLDKQPNGQECVIPYNNGAGVTPAIASAAGLYSLIVQQEQRGNTPRNLGNVKRFKMLYDERFSIGAQPAGLTSSVPGCTCLNIYKKFNIPIQYDTSTNNGDVGDIKTNALWLIVHSEVPGIVFSAYARVRFTDA